MATVSLQHRCLHRFTCPKWRPVAYCLSHTQLFLSWFNHFCVRVCTFSLHFIGVAVCLPHMQNEWCNTTIQYRTYILWAYLHHEFTYRYTFDRPTSDFGTTLLVRELYVQIFKNCLEKTSWLLFNELLWIIPNAMCAITKKCVLSGLPYLQPCCVKDKHWIPVCDRQTTQHYQIVTFSPLSQNTNNNTLSKQALLL